MGQNQGQKQKSHKAHKDAGHLLYKAVGIYTGGYGKADGAKEKHGAFGYDRKTFEKAGDGKIQPLGGYKKAEGKGNVHIEIGLKPQAYLPAHNKLEKGQKVVVVEDLISTGGSVIDVVDALREAGADVLGVVSIFTYGMQKGLDRLAAANVKNHSLTNFDVIADVAAKQNYIHPEDVARLIQFRNDPSDESWIGGKN